MEQVGDNSFVRTPTSGNVSVGVAGRSDIVADALEVSSLERCRSWCRRGEGFTAQRHAPNETYGPALVS
jgi:hypothetical protein